MSYLSRRKRAFATHSDDWLITYADMITLLLCFFVVFLIISISKKHAMPAPAPYAMPGTPIVQAPVQRFFAQKMPKQSEALFDADMIEPAVTEQPVTSSVPVPSPPVDVLSQTAPDVAEIIAHLKTDSAAPDTQKDMPARMVEMNSDSFFASGSAILSLPGRNLLQQVAAYLKTDAFKDYRVTIEAHTDDTPVGTLQFPSNWELSAARAAAIVHHFLEQGYPAQKLRAAGYADTFPLMPNRDAAGAALPANQAQNRRVVIRLERVEKN